MMIQPEYEEAKKKMLEMETLMMKPELDEKKKVKRDDASAFLSQYTDNEVYTEKASTAHAMAVEALKNGYWENVSEETIYIERYRTEILTRETCSCCKTQSVFCGKKRKINDDYCPACGAFLGKYRK